MTTDLVRKSNDRSTSARWNIIPSPLTSWFSGERDKKRKKETTTKQEAKPPCYFKYVACLMLLFPAAAVAHVKWFAEDNTPLFVSNDNTLLYSVVWAALAFGIVAAGIFLDKKLPWVLPTKLYDLPEIFRHRIVAIFRMLIGVYFLLATYQGYLFSMNLDNVGQFHSILIGVQAFVGLSFLFGIGVRPSSLLFLGLWLFSFFYAGPLNTLENLELLGIAIFTFICGRKYFGSAQEEIAAPNGLLTAGREYAVPLLRVAIGVNLVLLGFSEKILRPDLGLAFLEQHPWNFMKYYGVEWYSDYLFVFSAGAVEIILGLVLMLGIVTRICAVVTAVIFLIPPFFMGSSELLGHMPHLSVILLLMVFGSGNVLKLFSFSREKQNQINTREILPAQ